GSAPPFPNFDSEKTISLERIEWSNPSCGRSLPRSSRFPLPYLGCIPQFPRSTGGEKVGNHRRRGSVPQNCRLLNCNPLPGKLSLQLQDVRLLRTSPKEIRSNPHQTTGRNPN